MNIKIAASYCVFNDSTYLEYSIENILYLVPKVYLVVNSKAWQTAEPLSSRYMNYLLSLKNKYPNKIEVVKGFFYNEVEQRNYQLKLLAKEGYDYAFIIDSDEFYTFKDLDYIKNFIVQNPEIAIFRMRFKTYWQSFKYRIAPQEPSERVCCVRVAETEFYFSSLVTLKNKNFAEYTFDINELSCYHLSYALDDQSVLRKLRRSTHAFEISNQWYENTWLPWKKDKKLKNLHPIEGNSFEKTVEEDFIEFPEVLKKHPYFSKEIIPSESKVYKGFNESRISKLVDELKEKTSKITKIFLIGSGLQGLGRIPWIESLKAHFEFLGIDVYFYSIREMELYFNAKLKRPHNTYLLEDEFNLLYSNLQNELFKFQPDLIIDFYGMPKYIIHNSKKYLDTKIAFWYMESFTRDYAIELQNIYEYDFLFTLYDDFSENNKEKYKDFNKIILGCPVDVVQPEYSSNKEFSISMFATYYNNRFKFLNNFKNFKLNLFGAMPNEITFPNVKIYNNFYDFETLTKLANKSQVLINLHSENDDKVIFSHDKRAINPMTFFIGGTNCLQFIDNRENLASYYNEEEIVSFASLEELYDKLLFFSKNETISKKIIANMNNKTFDKFTMFDCLNELFEKII